MGFAKKIILFALLAGFTASAQAKEKFLLGIDAFEKTGFAELKGKRVGLITNHTGVNSKGKSTIDLLYAVPEIKLTALFSPEHGIRGTQKHGEKIADDKDAATGLPIYSLYGKTQRPQAAMLKDLDTLVFDIQDIGTRFYTYTTTLAYALEEAARRDIEFYVLDRPNPITGAIVEGEVLSPTIRHFTAYLQIPTRHGMTVGEIAHWYNKTAGLNAKLKVIKMEGWYRGMFWKDTKLKFNPPSPNIRSQNAAILYPGVGGLEATNVSVGRGTKKPFEVIGAPWINDKELKEKLDFYAVRGLEFRPIWFTPEDDLYKGQLCKGVEIKITNPYEARPVDLYYYLMEILTALYPRQFEPRWDEIKRITGSERVTNMMKTGDTAETILHMVHENAGKFEEARADYLLYEAGPAREE